MNQPETYYMIAHSSLAEALAKARWSGEDEDLIIETLKDRGELDEIEIEEVMPVA